MAERCVSVLITAEYLSGDRQTSSEYSTLLIICNTSAHTGQKITSRTSSHKS